MVLNSENCVLFFLQALKYLYNHFIQLKVDVIKNKSLKFVLKYSKVTKLGKLLIKINI